MSRNLNAEASAPKSGISTFGATAPTSQPADDSRGPELQGNTYTDKKTLTYDEKVAIIRAAIDKAKKGRIPYYGVGELDQLINHYRKDSVTPGQWVSFFTDLVFYIAKPEHSQAFHQSFPHGLDKISKLLGFFNDLNVDFDEYTAWCDYQIIEHDFAVSEFDFVNIAQVWLEGDEAKAVTGGIDGTGSFETMRDAMKNQSIQEALQARKHLEAIEALDRHFPGVQWPAEKDIVVLDPFIQRELDLMEKDRLLHESETPEQKTARSLHFEIKRAALSKVSEQLNAGTQKRQEWANKLAEDIRQNAAKRSTPATTVTVQAKKPTSKPATTTKKKA